MNASTVLAALLALSSRVPPAGPPPGGPVSPSDPAPPPQAPQLPTPTGQYTRPLPTVKQPDTPPAEQTVEQVMDALEQLKVQKAVLEKREQALTDLLKKKLSAQSERLKKLGVDQAEHTPPPPVIIEGAPPDSTPAETLKK